MIKLWWQRAAVFSVGVCLASAGAALARPQLPAIFSHGMVLQRSEATPVWGRAEPGEGLVISLGTLRVETRADEAGKWRTDLDLREMGQGPFELRIEGADTIVISDVLVGQVWLCSGQSNMEFTLSRTLEAKTEIAQSGNPRLRQYSVDRRASPKSDLVGEGKWKVADPSTTSGFTAVGYYFAKAIQAEIDEPVGLINASWGGTPIEAWISSEAILSNRDQAVATKMRDDWQMFPERRAKFASDLQKWQTKFQREDRRAADPRDFTGEDVPVAGWQPVTLPGVLSEMGLPDAGAVWLRRTVVIPESMVGRDLPLTIDDIHQFESVYWNGELVGESTPLNYKGEGSGGSYSSTRYYRVPATAVRAGENVVAIRLFTPFGGLRVGKGRFHVESVQRVQLTGQWLAREEFSLQPLKGAARDEAPAPLVAGPRESHVPGFLFAGMIDQLIPYGIQGVLWYQGETNVARAGEYRTLFPLLIEDWRTRWGQESFSFYYCQLPAYEKRKPEPAESRWAELREAQALAQALPETGQAVLIDLGEAGDIHPRDKKTVGNRLAALALAQAYDRSAPFAGPIYQSHEVEGDRVRIRFANAEGGLVAKALPETYLITSLPRVDAKLARNSPGGELEGFAICGEDHKWVWADATIEGSSVIVRSPQVPQPVAVRYAWADNPIVNLVNTDGLPAAPFRTDAFPPALPPAKL